MIVDPDFLDHWKTQMLCNELGDPCAALCLIRLWAHCQNRKSDTFENLTAEALRAICRWSGDANKFEGELVRAGFVYRDGTTITVHGWSERNKELVAKWKNGKLGGRPKSTNTNLQQTETESRLTYAEPTGNLNSISVNLPETEIESRVTDEIRLDESRGDKKKEHCADEPHDPGLGDGDDPDQEPYSDEFLEFWGVFPQGRRKNKGGAWKSWQKSIKRTKPTVIIEAAREYATSDEGRGQFVKMPSTWLNNECWLDDRVAWGGSQSQRTLAYTPEGMAKANDQDL